jgi:hypothetical protein
LSLTFDATGTKVVIVVRPCSGQNLSEASLWEMNEKGSMRQRQLWGVRAAASPVPTPSRLVVGEPPVGYREDPSLAGAVPGGDTWLSGAIQLSSLDSIDFRLRDLRKDMLLVDPAWLQNKRYVSADEFEQVNAAECGRA